MNISVYPKDLEEAIDTLLTFFVKDLVEVKTMTESEFIGASHHFGGQFIRNNWNLWWHKEHDYEDWPKEKPELVEFFNNLGIAHADDMSGIILRSLYRRIFNKPLEIEEQIKEYKEFWKGEGFSDGIFDYKNK